MGESERESERSVLQEWLNMAVLDLQESKRSGACALEQSRVLMMEKEILQEKLNIHLDWWDMDKRQLEEALALVKKDQETKIVTQEYEISSLKISMGFQQQEALRFKLRLEHAMDDVELLSSRLHIFGLRLQENEAWLKEKDKLLELNERHAHLRACHELASVPAELVHVIQHKGGGGSFDHQQLLDELTGKHKVEIENLKQEHCSASSKTKQEICALIREKNFVWDQLKRMEDSYCSRLNKKGEELKVAEEAIEKLELKVDELQKSHDEKTVEVTVLKINVQAVEDELHRLKKGLANMDGVTLDNTNQDHEASANAGAELRVALKLVDELRLENQNLRLLYADLEAHVKQKPERQKPEKHNREPGKDETTRNLTAELEAVATTTVDAKVTKLHAKLKASESQISISTRRKRPLVESKENCELPNDKNLSHKRTRVNDVHTPKDPTITADRMEDPEEQHRQLIHHRNSNEQHASTMKNKLFSSVFAIPKVVSGT